MRLDRVSISFVLAGAAAAVAVSASRPPTPLSPANTPAGGEPPALVGPASTPTPPPAAATPAARFRSVIADPKPLSDAVRRGIAWLIAHQHASGGWSQGDEASSMGQGGSLNGEAPNVGDTCTALLAILRSGADGRTDQTAAALDRGFAWLCAEIERSDASTMQLSSPQGTRLQSKLGPSIDTFLASLALSEGQGRMSDPADEARIDAALKKVLAKIAASQRPDGTWTDQGWAPVLAEAVAAKGLNRAAQSQFEVDPAMLARITEQAQRTIAATGGFDGAGNAGVQLYAGASNLGKLQDAAVTMDARTDDLKAVLTSAAAPAVRDEAAKELRSIAEIKQSCDEMRQSVVARLDDPGFVAGFGSNGGEEFLSYLNIGESLAMAGGEAWTTWDAAMTANLQRIQNEDGSWTGHHCITGRTFCTASALLVVMTDRTPVPAESTSPASLAPAEVAGAPGK